MTQQLYKQQGFDRQFCENSSFNAPKNELEREQNYQKSESSYIQCKENWVEKEFGKLWRVWDK